NPWSTVRFWLFDLAEELEGMLSSPDTASGVVAERLWISKSGRLLLLDFKCPDLATSAEGEAEPMSNLADLQKFLVKIGDQAMGGSSKAVPLHARSFLQTLSRQAFEKTEFILGNLNSLMAKAADVSRGQRTASLFFLPGIIFISGLCLGLMLGFSNIRAERAWGNEYPGHPGFPAAARLYATYLERAKAGENTKEDMALMNGYLAAHFGFMATNDAFWAKSEIGLMGEQLPISRLREAVRSPLPSEEKLLEIDKVIPRRIAHHASTERMMGFWFVIGWWIFCAAALGLVEFVWILARGEHPVLRLFSLAVVDREGRAASRLHLLGRWALVWLPGSLAGCFSVLAFMTVEGMQEVFPLSTSGAHQLQVAGLATLLICGTLWFGFAVIAAVNPRRGLHDRIARTWLVIK
ncbi:MAG TPA: RDD family protein, partial [Candidatus Saccharimonadales bacterium]|nr:RDD family protein [Candidatus Saccharimonadales bacterium]